MTVTLGSNIASLKAIRGLGSASQKLSDSYERLSSGLRINKASDDAAGLSIASQLSAKSRVFTQALRNVNDGVSATSVAEGALTSLKEISQRQLELAEQAANGSYSIVQRRSLNSEANKLVDEYNRIISSTSFNGVNLLSPSLGPVSIQAGFGTDGILQLSTTSDLRRAVGDGTFTQGASVPSPNAFAAVVTGDFNGDGVTDILAGGQYANPTMMFFGNADGSFAAGITMGGFTYGLAAGDLNGDGKLDLMIADYIGYYYEIGLNQGNGTFQINNLLPESGPGHPQSVALGDFNGDGKLDLISKAYSQDPILRFGNGDGTFQQGIDLTSIGGGSPNLSAGDVNADGYMDIVDFTYGHLFLGNGDGTFTGPLSTPIGGVEGTLVDINDDGRLDLVGGLYAAFGNGDGSFRAAFNDGIPATGLQAGIADFNRDGVMDYVDVGATGLQIFNGNRTYVTSASYLNITAQQGARAALNTVREGLNRIEAQLSSLGAVSSRFTTAIGTLQVERENFQAASSRIFDADIASESSELTREQILQQAASSVLAQANQQPALALQLLNR